MRFTISKLLFATAVIAVFLGLRHSYVYSSPVDAPSIISRAWWVTWAMAVIVSAYICAQCSAQARRRTIVWNAALAGGAAAALSAAILGVEIAQGVGDANPGYWDWRRDYLSFLVFVIGRGLMVGSILGAILGAIWGVAAPRRRLVEINDAQSK